MSALGRKRTFCSTASPRASRQEFLTTSRTHRRCNLARGKEAPKCHLGRGNEERERCSCSAAGHGHRHNWVRDSTRRSPFICRKAEGEERGTRHGIAVRIDGSPIKQRGPS